MLLWWPARVQPGVICDALRDAAEPYGLTFGPDPATHDHATLGGMIGNNSCGTHWVMAGKTVDNIEELEIVTYDGTRMRVGPTGEADLERIILAGGRRGAIYAGLRPNPRSYAQVIREGMPDIRRRPTRAPGSGATSRATPPPSTGRPSGYRLGERRVGVPTKAGRPGWNPPPVTG